MPCVNGPAGRLTGQLATASSAEGNHAASASPTAGPAGPGSIGSTQHFNSTSPLISANGNYAAVLTGDGSFVLCFTTNGVPDLARVYWSAAGNGAGQFSVIHDGSGKTVPRGGPPYQAIMWADGNLVLFVGDDPENIGAPYCGAAPIPRNRFASDCTSESPKRLGPVSPHQANNVLRAPVGSPDRDHSGAYRRPAEGRRASRRGA